LFSCLIANPKRAFISLYVLARSLVYIGFHSLHSPLLPFLLPVPSRPCTLLHPSFTPPPLTHSPPPPFLEKVVEGMWMDPSGGAFVTFLIWPLVCVPCPFQPSIRTNPAVFVHSSHKQYALPQPIHPVPFPPGSPLRNSPRTCRRQFTRRLQYARSVLHSFRRIFLHISTHPSSRLRLLAPPLIFPARDFLAFGTRLSLSNERPSLDTAPNP
jgi:hypothetical protein